ncbi:MAG: neutral/alkaline non-lysosomal ceramidase N-terminal domain-containing protein [Desulfamplus sp.]|nr:neutral/alkaline non-lysosomal ceramidase N-terminal domain-containing protein [Desulfamplus sp.]
MKKKKNRKTAAPINIKPDEPMAAESLNSIKNLIDAGHELSGSNIQDKCRETIELLHKKLKTNPDDYPAYFYLSQLYMNVKDENNGIEYAKKCLALLQRIKNNSDKSNNDLSFYYSIYHILALALISQKNYNEALDIIKEGLKKLPDDIDLLYDLACAGYFLNDPSLMIKGGESYLRLLEQNENNNNENNNIRLTNQENNRIISTTSQSAIFSVKCWLIIAYIQINNTDDFSKLWEELKLQLKEQTADEQPSDYKNIALTFLVSMADSLLTQNQSRKFLEISSFILTTYLEHQLESIKGASELASAYNMLAQQQDKTEQGITIALSSLNIAWILTDDSQYLDAIKKIKMNNFSQLEEIAQPDADNKLKDNQSSTVTASNKSKNSAPAFFRTAFAEVDITPKISDANPVYLQGMAGKERKAIGVASPLKMQMLLIEDKNQAKILFVAADIFGFGSEMVELVRKTASGWGIPPERIILNASHTHYAPGTLSHTFRTMGPFFKEYAMEIAGIVGNSISMLHDNLEESYIYSGKTDISVGVSSRLGENGTIEFQPDETASYDQHTPFFLFEQQKSNKKIIMVNHGCHPTGLGTENNISADFPGYFRDELIKTGKVDHVMYLQGASGDIRESSIFDGGKVLCSRLEDAQKNGRVMAQSIQSVLDSDYSLMMPLTESKISSISKTIYLRLKKIPDINQINLIKNDPLSEPVVREWASRLSLTYPNGDFPNALALDIQVVSIGNSSTFICFPAAPVSSIGINLKKLTDSPDTTFILGNTNGLICYIPDDKRIEYGGYEADISPYYYMIPYLLAKGAEFNIISEVTNCYLKVCSSSNCLNR